jgi:hypothetical protein
VSEFYQVIRSEERGKMKKNIRLSKTLIIRLLVILILILALMIMKKIESGFLVYSNGAKTLDMRFGYNATDVLNLFTTLSVEGRSIYVEYLCDDFIFIASFAIVQNYILKFVIGKEMLNSTWRTLLSIAYLRAFFDVTENIIILILLNRFPSMLTFLITIASNVTKFKFILLGIWSLAIPITLLARLIMKKRKK